MVKRSLAIGQLAGVRFLTETVRPEIYGTVSIALGLVVLGRSQFSLPFAMASMRQYAEAARREDVDGLTRVVRYWLLRSQAMAAALVLLIGVPYCLFRSISLWLPALTFGLFVVDGEIMLEAAFLNASKRHRLYSLLRGTEAWIRPILAVALVHLVQRFRRGCPGRLSIRRLDPGRRDRRCSFARSQDEE